MEQTSRFTLDQYEKSDLALFTRQSDEMQFDKSEWGKNKQWNCSINEDSFVLSDDESKLLSSKSSERLGLSEKFTPRFKFLQFERFMLLDDWNINLDGKFKENIEISDEANVALSRKTNEGRISVIDQDERAPNTILYDLEVLNKTEDDFSEFSSSVVPLNYNQIRPLYAGDYEYKNAIVGFQVSLNPSSGRYGVSGCKLHVDIQDVVAKGRTKVDSSGSQIIEFSALNPPKKFLTIPQVLYGKVEAEEDYNVEITEITRQGFKIGLKSKSTGSYINGTIDWLADGY